MEVGGCGVKVSKRYDMNRADMNKIQTHERFKRTLFIGTKHNKNKQRSLKPLMVWGIGSFSSSFLKGSSHSCFGFLYFYINNWFLLLLFIYSNPCSSGFMIMIMIYLFKSLQ